MNDWRMELDVLVVGGGIGGLWLLHRLRRKGYHAILFERARLGGGQTLAAQGIIHGGLKYALGGAAERAARAVAEMPARWSACLAGHGDVDLRSARTLSPHTYLWCTPELSSRVGARLASHLLNGRTERLPTTALPPPLDDGGSVGAVYRLSEPVVDTCSVVAALDRACSGRIFAIDWRTAGFIRDDAGTVLGIEARVGDRRFEFRAGRTVLCAGTGNEELLAQLGAARPRMQRRALHQVLVKHPSLRPLYAHCMGRGRVPRLTVSSHRHRDGEWIWYLGGELAERGCGRAEPEQIAAARAELTALFPRLDLHRAEWRSLRVDRAEPRMHNERRPDDVWTSPADGADGVLVGWPTKLCLAPVLADRILDALGEMRRGTRAFTGAEARQLALSFGAPPAAEPPWAGLFA